MEDERKKNVEEGKAEYEDILYCSRPISYKRNPMQRSHRAKQFAAFDALKGYEEAVREQEHLYEPYRELAPEKAEEIDWKLHRIHCHDRVKVTWFQAANPDNRSTGNYYSELGEIQNLETQERWLQINDRVIPFRNITNLEQE